MEVNSATIAGATQAEDQLAAQDVPRVSIK
jgi:hypothetical protein